MNSPLNRDAGRAEGKRRRDHKLAVVEARRPVETAKAQLRMLQAMRERPDRTGSSDDSTPERVEYADNAPWIGASVRSLGLAGIIVRAGYQVSCRPSRNGNEIKRWQLASDEAADEKIEQLTRLVESYEPPESPPPAQEKTQQQLALPLGENVGPQPAKVEGHDGAS